MSHNSPHKILSLNNPDLASTMGLFIKHHRLKQNKTQEELSIQSGIKRKTITRIENGSTFNVITFLQILRSLNMLESIMYVFKIDDQISPLVYAKMQSKIRQRARHKNNKKSTK